MKVSYYSLEDGEDRSFELPYRSIQILAELCGDYAGILERAVEEALNDEVEKVAYRIRAKQVRDIGDVLADAIKLDRTYPKCKRTGHSDVGDEAMNLLARKRKEPE